MNAAGLTDWLRANAERLDESGALAEAVLPALAGADLLGVGVPRAAGGHGGDVRDAIDSIAAVAQHSLTAAFVYWGQRTYIEYLLHSPNRALCEQSLPALLSGARAGATGLSNAMKFLSGIEQLQISATRAGAGWRLDGALPWVTNLRQAGFVAAAAVAPAEGGPAAIVAFDSACAGVQRGADLELIALRGSNTASVRLEQVEIGPGQLIAADAASWLPTVRPAFLGMQCGMSIGLARASLERAGAISSGSRNQLTPRVAALQEQLRQHSDALLAGVHDGRFQRDAAAAFRLRIALAELVQQALMLELQAMGGRAYLQNEQAGFGRRWREAAFIPVVTPSLTQLQAVLAQHEPAPA